MLILNKNIKKTILYKIVKITIQMRFMLHIRNSLNRTKNMLFVQNKYNLILQKSQYYNNFSQKSKDILLLSSYKTKFYLSGLMSQDLKEKNLLKHDIDLLSIEYKTYHKFILGKVLYNFVGKENLQNVSKAQILLNGYKNVFGFLRKIIFQKI